MARQDFLPPVTLASGYDPSRLAQSGDSRMPIVGMPGDSLARDPIVTMQEVDDPVEYLSGQQPVYPQALRRVGVEGWNGHTDDVVYR